MRPLNFETLTFETDADVEEFEGFGILGDAGIGEDDDDE